MAKIELPNQQLHEAVSLRRRISIVLRLLLSCVYLSSCFSYQNNPQEISDFEELANLKQEKDRYCTQLSLKFDNREYAHPLPSMFTEYGKCLEQGFMVTAKSSENMKVILPDAGKAISLYNAAAQCLDREAIEVLKSKGLPVPPFSGREEGIYFSPYLFPGIRIVDFMKN